MRTAPVYRRMHTHAELEYVHTYAYPYACRDIRTLGNSREREMHLQEVPKEALLFSRQLYIT